MILSTLKKKLLNISISIFFFTTTLTLHAAKNSPPSNKFTIEHEGHWFYTTYNLSIPQHPFALTVEMVAGNTPTTTGIAKIPGPITPGPFGVWWNVYKSNKTIQKLTFCPARYGNKINNLEESLEPHWHATFKLLATKVAPPYFLLGKNERQKHNLKNLSLISPSSDIKPLPTCKLETRDYIYNTAHAFSYMPNANGIHVKVSTQIEKDQKGKKRLTSVATFSLKNKMSSLSSIKFIVTKKGLKGSSKKHISRSSPWYPAIKKSVRANLKKYRAFAQTHLSFVKIYACQKTQAQQSK